MLRLMEDKIVVVGAGFLGARIAGEFGCSAFGRRDVDVLRKNSIADLLDKEKPSVVVNAVAKSGRNIEWCEEHVEETMAVNVVGALNLAFECERRGIFIVHLGTGCIYQGDNDGRGFSEQDLPNFDGQVYAESKRLAEELLPESVAQLRIRLPVDDRPHPRNLIDKIAGWSKVSAAKNSITCVPDMIEAMKVIITRRASGIYNFTNPGQISFAEIATMYKEIVDSSYGFESVSVEAATKMMKVPRAMCSLNTDKARKIGIKMPEVYEAVKTCLENYKIRTILS